MKAVRRTFMDFIAQKIWEPDTRSLGRYRLFLIKAARLCYVAFREFTEGQLSLRAMSIVYSVLLSLVPVLAISLSVLKAFGVHNEIVEPFLLKFLEPLGARGAELTDRIIGFVENMRVGILGSLGLALLVFTVISVIKKIESAFNYIWRIKKSRSLLRRFSDYISVIVVGPVLVFSAIGITAAFMSNTIVQRIVAMEPFGSFYYLIAEIIPYVLICTAFTFVYLFIPNTRVKIKSALVGGLFAGVLWETAGWLFGSFMVTSTKYAAIYSGFAILILFMIWLYLSWLILLVGAQVSFYHQYPHFFSARKEVFRLSHRLREKLAFLVMFLIGHNFYHDAEPWTLDSLVRRIDLPVEPVQDVLELLEHNQFVLETHDDPPAYLPARDLGTIRIKELLNSVRAFEKEAYAVEERTYSRAEVDEIMKTLDAAIDDTFGDETLRDLVSRTEAVQELNVKEAV